MGVGTDAILVYGFEVEVDSDEHTRCEELIDEAYDELYSAEMEYEGELVPHCSNECTMFIVGLGGLKKARRGSPVEIDVQALADETGHDPLDTRLAEFAKAIGLKPRPGKWLLCSYWG